jgi:hypothetical protein
MMSLREVWALHEETEEESLVTIIGQHGGVQFLLNSDKIRGKRLFLVKFPAEFEAEGFENVLFRSLVIQMLDFGIYKELTFLILRAELGDIFISFAEDLLFHTSTCSTPKEVLSTVSSVISQWLKLFERAVSGLMSLESEKGLFGELLCFRTLVVEGYPLEILESAWEGPLWADRDYAFPNAKLEVKLSSAKHPSLKISSERQLEIVEGEREFILFYEVGDSPFSGESITNLVQDIRRMISKNPTVLERFNAKIGAYGYADEDQNAYTRKFTVRNTNVYLISADFPRITRHNLAIGLFNVRFEIELSACEPFRQLFTTLTEIINGH